MVMMGHELLVKSDKFRNSDMKFEQYNTWYNVIISTIWQNNIK